MVNVDEFFRNNLMPSGFAVQRAQERLDAFQAGAAGFRTGLKDLDRLVRFLPGELTVVGARAGTGKTSFGMQMVHGVLSQLEDRKQPGCIAVFSAEMDGETLMLREACALEKISLWAVQTRECSDAEYQRLRDRLATLADTRLLIDESPAPTLEHMVEQLGAVATERGSVRLVLFDYTELAGEFDREESRRVAKISRGLKGIAKQFACPVLTLSQLNRDIEARADKTPAMRDLMHGGEREPDRIIVLVRPWAYDKAQPKQLINAYVVKNRNGPQGEAQLYFEEESMRFYSALVTQKRGG